MAGEIIMKIINIGSMNLDHVYQMDHIVQPGETEASAQMDIFLGGKGMNQSIALAKAGAEVYHAGLIGGDGEVFLEACRKYGVHGEFIEKVQGRTGHAIIQVDCHAQNSILLYGGANQMLTEAYVDQVLSHFEKGDILLLQNEVNLLPYIVDRAFEKGLKIALNPSPFNEKILEADLGKIGIFLLNEVEGEQITGEKEPDKIIAAFRKRWPGAEVVLTLGKNGAVYADSQREYFQEIFKVKAVDTTAAGDTFTGYFLAGYAAGLSIPEVLKISAKAASIAVSRQGAVPSIPCREEVLASLT